MSVALIQPSHVQSDEANASESAALAAALAADGSTEASQPLTEEDPLTEEEVAAVHSAVSADRAGEVDNVWIVKPSHLSKGQGERHFEVASAHPGAPVSSRADRTCCTVCRTQASGASVTLVRCLRTVLSLSSRLWHSGTLRARWSFAARRSTFGSGCWLPT